MKIPAVTKSASRDIPTEECACYISMTIPAVTKPVTRDIPTEECAYYIFTSSYHGKK